jgi:hypothetical protein
MNDMRTETHAPPPAGARSPAAVRFFEHGGIFASCAAIVVCGAYVTKSAAAGGLEDQPGAASASQASPFFDITIPKDYRDWRLVSVAHEAGDLNDIRAILGNDAAIEAYRDGKPAFPDGAIIARLAWKYVAADEDNKVFGREQSFVAGPQPNWYLQLMVKDSIKYAATGGWGFAQFDKNGNPSADRAKLETCFPCHVPAKTQDYVFTHYAH